MARLADPGLEQRILDAAQKLWIMGGTDALTMRAVAATAGTTTPTLYQRFKDRQDILRGLLLRIREEVMQGLEAAGSPEEMCQRYLQYGLTHPHEYELFFAHSYEIFSETQRRARSYEEGYPGRELVRRKLAEFLGGVPDDYTQLHLVLWATLHGTIMLLNSKTIHGTHVRQMRESCVAVVNLILRDARKVRKKT